MMELPERLRQRRSEIEEAALARAYAISDPSEVDDPEYAIGLRAAVAAALSYGIETLARANSWSGPIPDSLLAQARYAVRSSVSLDTVLRRYFAGHMVLCDFIVSEAEAGSLAGANLQDALRSVSALFDRLVAAVAEEYIRTDERQAFPLRQHHAEWVGRLLAGEFLDATKLRYDLDVWHLGAVACGSGASAELRRLATALDRRLLLTGVGESTVWAWFGGRRKVAASEVLMLAERNLPREMTLALGEPGRGVDGWRLTHRQALAAMPVALRGPKRRVRYAEIALLASALRDDTLARSLIDLYLTPLKKERDGGRSLRETLRSYFAAERNVSSAAAALGVSRRTVANRLRTVEEHLGHSVDSCAGQIETALRFEELSAVITMGDVIPGTDSQAGSPLPPPVPHW